MRRWSASHGRATATVTNESVSRWLAQWVATLLHERNLYADAEQFLAKRLQKSPELIHVELRIKTQRELQLIFEEAHLDDSRMGSDRLCRWILEHSEGGTPLSSDKLVRVQTMWTEFNPEGIADAFHQLVGLLSQENAPTLLVLSDNSDKRSETPEEIGNQSELLRAQVDALTHLAVRVPQLTAGLAVEEKRWNTFVSLAPESFAKAVIREHVIPVAGLTVDQIRQMIASKARRDTSTLEPVINQLAKMGISPELIESFAEMSAATQGTTSSSADPWKSEEERFFFQLLEHTTDLCGLFQLNVSPGFLFGNKPAEVDLACLDLKIAVEIDGYHHFTDPEHYRRDRRKDLVLQQHGYFVLRFLAEDVVPEMAAILKTIRDVVQMRVTRTHI